MGPKKSFILLCAATTVGDWNGLCMSQMSQRSDPRRSEDTAWCEVSVLWRSNSIQNTSTSREAS